VIKVMTVNVYSGIDESKKHGSILPNAKVWTIFLTPALEAPYIADGTL